MSMTARSGDVQCTRNKRKGSAGQKDGERFMAQVDMNKVVGRCHILFLCFDSLRYDVAVMEQETGGTPVLNQYGNWEKRQTHGNFTYPAHQAMFAGFLPVSPEITKMKERETLFFSENIGFGRKAPLGAFSFQGANIMEGLRREGYRTCGIGGVHFFDNRSALGKVFPSYFSIFDFHPSFGPAAYDSARAQVDVLLKRLLKFPEEKIFYYVNFSAMHYPTWHYLSGSRRDSIETQRAALRYVDGELSRLFHAFRERGETFVICLSDHGTCFGEDGIWYHGINHPNVLTVPYKHFFLSKEKQP